MTARGQDTSGPTAPPVSPSRPKDFWVPEQHAVPAARAVTGSSDSVGGLGPLVGFVSGVSGLPGLSLQAEFWTRLHELLKPSPAFYHFILTHFRWFWDIVNSTFIRDTLMRLVLTGEGLEWVWGCSRTWGPPGHCQRWSGTAAVMLSSSHRRSGHPWES